MVIYVVLLLLLIAVVFLVIALRDIEEGWHRSMEIRDERSVHSGGGEAGRGKVGNKARSPSNRGRA